MREIFHNQQEDRVFLDSPMTVVVPVRLFLTSRLRNAWHGTTSHQIKGDTSLQNSFGLARGVAERWRQRGSHFLIRETPGIAIISRSGVAAVVDSWADDPFADWNIKRGKPWLRVGTPVRDLLSSLSADGDWVRRPDEWSALQAWASQGSLSRAGERAPFDTVHSWITVDGDLEWESYDGMPYGTRGISRIRRAFTSVNGAGTIDRAFASYRDSGRDEDPLLGKRRSLLG